MSWRFREGSAATKRRMPKSPAGERDEHALAEDERRGSSISWKPRVRRTAISVTLSRAAIAIVFPAIRRMTRTMMAPIEVMRSFTFPSIDTIPFRNAFSVSVFVG